MHSHSAHSRLAAAVAEEPHMPQAGKQGTQAISQPDSCCRARDGRDGLDSTGPGQGLQRYGGAAGGDGARGATQRYAAKMPAGRLHIVVHSDVPHFLSRAAHGTLALAALDGGHQEPPAVNSLGMLPCLPLSLPIDSPWGSQRMMLPSQSSRDPEM
ncbi:hypothetical protein CKAH01_00658 [Colletotrichum kahawae]|uniref:Uncharacterized protein n=1 Tax=Colletotrichum kahawae TaxID=34407 RepID=A0AAD9YIB7_COLKA|nr:hypothetical protein CKAH01_00658 [Colletotrichum kahawae]